jgi:fatty-acyl-CoA synthase
MKPGRTPLDADAVRAWCQGRIAQHKIPRYVRISETFPMTVTGKIRKVEMRQISIGELGLHDAAATATA